MADMVDPDTLLVSLEWSKYEDMPIDSGLFVVVCRNGYSRVLGRTEKCN